MMKRHDLLVIFALLGVAFLVLTWFKLKKDDRSDSKQNIAPSVTGVDSARIFWRDYDRATRYRAGGDVDLAVAAYRQALAIKPMHRDTLYYLGNMYLRAGRGEAAERTWERLIALNPLSARTLKQLGALYFCPRLPALFRPATARRYLRHAAALNPSSLEIQARLGEVVLFEKNAKSARRIFSDIAIVDDKNAEAHFILGYLDWKQHAARSAVGASRLASKSIERLHRLTSGEGGRAVGAGNIDAGPSHACGFITAWFRHVPTPSNGSLDLLTARRLFASFDIYLSSIRRAMTRAKTR